MTTWVANPLISDLLLLLLPLCFFSYSSGEEFDGEKRGEAAHFGIGIGGLGTRSTLQYLGVLIHLLHATGYYSVFLQKRKKKVDRGEA